MEEGKGVSVSVRVWVFCHCRIFESVEFRENWWNLGKLGKGEK
jgi:hypothetical protein